MRLSTAMALLELSCAEQEDVVVFGGARPLRGPNGGGSLTAFRTESRRKKKVIENFSSSYRILFLFGPELHLLTRKKNRHHGEDQEEGYVLNIVFD